MVDYDSMGPIPQQLEPNFWIFFSVIYHVTSKFKLRGISILQDFQRAILL